MADHKQEIDAHRYSILFVDDEEMARLYFERICEPEFDVITAADANMALEILEKNHQKIAILITDQRMPGISGSQLLKIAKKRYPSVIRMLTTAYMDMDETIDLVIQWEILYKPWKAEILKTALSGAMILFNEQIR
jgi:two-component system probable response regulator PhcQ